jgi:hypothetical protein
MRNAIKTSNSPSTSLTEQLKNCKKLETTYFFLQNLQEETEAKFLQTYTNNTLDSPISELLHILQKTKNKYLCT